MASPQKIRTPATDLLGIKHPVLLAGMFNVASPRLAAAVSNAGGLGVIGGVAYTPEKLREALDELKGYLVDKSAPFGVDLLIPQVGGNARKTNYDYSHGKLDELIEIIISSGAKLFVCAKAIDAGADLLCAQGGEGGGHTGEIPTVVLIPAVSQIVRGQKSAFTGHEVLLVAAGGMFNGQTLAAALMLGASAVWVGTRFILAEESGASEMHKKGLEEAGFDDIIRTTVFSGRPLNTRTTPYLRRWEGERKDEMLALQARGVIPIAHDMDTKPEDDEVLDNAHPVLMGRVAGLVNERLTAKQIVDGMVEEANALLIREAVSLDGIT
ncbi:conserved hypothetical protein [Aspergillus terreus NIH2624]|uniref:Nitronate monooxygenase domain-containing protein n=1 Tax=Aspergillus terreus (strain NIH 2624 / FGSC A1156) TaxID=341663 RepID=Q0CYM1_ASPTN|nr:uncharacterized protein ATEG_01213 [Aspergillus terreus NIH2624]EAU37970.1 conserved hypothetical protein [Aspergillus terreus NIH2624]